MADELIRQATELMREQTRAYQRLSQDCEELRGSLTCGVPERIAVLVRAGETELNGMRARLIRLMSALAEFAGTRTESAGQEAAANSLSAEVRAAFATASNELAQTAREFQRAHQRTSTLANNGAIFVSTAIELCGIPPITYRAPYARFRDE